jgi:nucleoside-diphosphate-sugar epimerase
MRSIVTGGAGFIGSNLAETLAQHHDVVIIDNLATGRRENIEHLLDHPRVTFIEGSITDLDLLMETFPGADGVFGGDPLGAAVGDRAPSPRMRRT